MSWEGVGECFFACFLTPNGPTTHAHQEPQANPSRQLVEVVNTLEFPPLPKEKTVNFLANSCFQTTEGSLKDFVKTEVEAGATNGKEFALAVIKQYKRFIDVSLELALLVVLPALYAKVKELYPEEFPTGKFLRTHKILGRHSCFTNRSANSFTTLRIPGASGTSRGITVHGLPQNEPDLTVERRPLVDRTYEKLRPPSLVRICAPAGTGKTCLGSLVARRAESEGRRVEFFFLDADAESVPKAIELVRTLPRGSLLVLDDVQYAYTEDDSLTTLASVLRNEAGHIAVLLLMVYPFKAYHTSPIEFGADFFFNDLRLSKEEEEDLYGKHVARYLSLSDAKLAPRRASVFEELWPLVRSQSDGHAGAIVMFARIIDEEFRSGSPSIGKYILSQDVLTGMGRLWPRTSAQDMGNSMAEHRDFLLLVLSGLPIIPSNVAEQVAVRQLLRFGLIFETDFDPLRGTAYQATTLLVLRLFLRSLFPGRNPNADLNRVSSADDCLKLALDAIETFPAHLLANEERRSEALFQHAFYRGLAESTAPTAHIHTEKRAVNVNGEPIGEYLLPSLSSSFLPRIIFV